MFKPKRIPVAGIRYRRGGYRWGIILSMTVALAYLDSIDRGIMPMAFDATLHTLEREGYIEHYHTGIGNAYRITEAGKVYLDHLKRQDKFVREHREKK